MDIRYNTLRAARHGEWRKRIERLRDSARSMLHIGVTTNACEWRRHNKMLSIPIVKLHQSVPPSMSEKLNLDDVPFTKSEMELEARDKRRLEMFIDAVFAIAITLLGFGFVAPVVRHSNEALVGSLTGIAPNFAGYFLAFALVGIMLNNNWRQFQNIAYANWVLYFINIVFLSFVVLVPFATTVWTTYPDTTAGVLVFHSVIFIAGVILYANWAYVRWRPHLLKKDITGQTLKEIAYRDASFPPASALAIVLAFISPILSNTAYILIVVIMAMALHQRRRRRTSHQMSNT